MRVYKSIVSLLLGLFVVCAIPVIAAPQQEPVLEVRGRLIDIREAKAGVRSESYLECYKGERLLFRKRLRTDEYRPIQGIIGKKIAK